jgi:hypothetical protein
MAVGLAGASFFTIAIVKIWKFYSRQKYLRSNEKSMLAKLILQNLELLIDAFLLWQAIVLSVRIKDKGGDSL